MKHSKNLLVVIAAVDEYHHKRSSMAHSKKNLKKDRIK